MCVSAALWSSSFEATFGFFTSAVEAGERQQLRCASLRGRKHSPSRTAKSTPSTATTPS